MSLAHDTPDHIRELRGEVSELWSNNHFTHRQLPPVSPLRVRLVAAEARKAERRKQLRELALAVLIVVVPIVSYAAWQMSRVAS